MRHNYNILFRDHKNEMIESIEKNKNRFFLLKRETTIRISN